MLVGIVRVGVLVVEAGFIGVYEEWGGEGVGNTFGQG